MQLNGNVHCLFQRLNQIIGAVRGQQTGHILNADRVCTCVLQLLRVMTVVFRVKHRTGGVRNCSLYMTAVFLGCVNGSLQITHVVECVKNTQNINTVINTLLYKVIHQLVGIMPIAQHILPAEEHLQLRIGALFADQAQSVPGILIQKAQAGVKSGTAPALQRMITDLVHLL